MNVLDQAIWNMRVKEAVESRKEGAVSNENLVIIVADNEIKRLTDELAAIKRGRNAYFNNRGEDFLRDKIGFLINELRRKNFKMGKIKDEVSRLESTVVTLQKELKASWPPVQDKGSDV